MVKNTLCLDFKEMLLIKYSLNTQLRENLETIKLYSRYPNMKKFIPKIEEENDLICKLLKEVEK